MKRLFGLIMFLMSFISMNAQSTEVKERVNNIYTHVFKWYLENSDPQLEVTPKENFDSLYLSTGLNQLLVAFVNSDSDELDFDYWINAQDWGNDLSFQVVNVNMQGMDKGLAIMRIKNNGNSQTVTLSIIRERGKWVIDNIMTNKWDLRNILKPSSGRK